MGGEQLLGELVRGCSRGPRVPSSGSSGGPGGLPGGDLDKNEEFRGPSMAIEGGREAFGGERWGSKASAHLLGGLLERRGDPKPVGAGVPETDRRPVSASRTCCTPSSRSPIVSEGSHRGGDSTCGTGAPTRSPTPSARTADADGEVVDCNGQTDRFIRWSRDRLTTPASTSPRRTISGNPIELAEDVRQHRPTAPQAGPSTRPRDRRRAGRRRGERLPHHQRCRRYSG